VAHKKVDHINLAPTTCIPHTHTENFYYISTVGETLSKLLFNMSTFTAITEATRFRNCSKKSVRCKHVHLWHHDITKNI